VSSRISGSVRIVGAGLLGTSIGLALTKNGVDVIITDESKSAENLAISYGAGRESLSSDLPMLVVVCVPPEATSRIVVEELKNNPQAIVTDVASVKKQILDSLTESAADLTRYVGSHPMAGRERSGAIAGRADLFIGRPWVISPTTESSVGAITQVENLAVELGAAPVKVTAEDHDRAVALVSHLPQAVASLTAAQLIGADHQDVSLAGQGIRDTIRIAASDPNLWVQILSANSSEVVALLENLQEDLSKLVNALHTSDSEAGKAVIREVLTRGNLGSTLLPGKHGAKPTEYSVITVIVEDKPGELARLLVEVGEIGVNLEELKLEHSPSSQIGLAELFVLPSSADKLVEELQIRNWRLVS
jgi:prephenate dehydrogenase